MPRGPAIQQVVLTAMQIQEPGIPAEDKLQPVLIRNRTTAIIVPIEIPVPEQSETMMVTEMMEEESNEIPKYY